MSNNMHEYSFDEIIEKNWPCGFKKTRQRIDIYRVLYGSELPLSASEIYESLHDKGRKDNYAISTIYRNLLAFEKAGIVVKNILTTEDNALYELKKETHKHYAVCLCCHKKIPLESCPLHDLSHDLKDSIPDFKVTGHQLEIYGYCKDCSKKL